MENYWNTILFCILVIALFFTVRGNIKFDLNEYLKDRRENKKQRVRTLCPHMDVTRDEKGSLQFRSFYIPNLGGIGWKCRTCGSETTDEFYIKETFKYWVNNPKEYEKRRKKMIKLA